jgi:NTE family protein
MNSSPFKTALVLSGGSARALSHLGVLAELDRHGIPVDIVVGTSMGAIIGGLYAYHRDVPTVIEKFHTLFEDDIFLQTVSVLSQDVPEVIPNTFLNRCIWVFKKGVFYAQSVMSQTLIAEKTYSEIMNALIPECNIEDLPIPFAAVAMDLFNGDEIVLTRGPLREAVSASAAIPGILPAVGINGRTLADGGWVDNVPVEPAIALGAHFVIAVDASTDLAALGPMPTNALESLFRCNEITRITLDHHRRSFADILLVPRIGQLYWTNFSGMDRCLSAGRVVLKENIRLIRRQSKLRRLATIWGRLHPARMPRWRHPFVLY